MKTLARYELYIAALVLAGFCWLSLISLRYEPNYTRSEIQGMDRLISRITAPPSTFKARQAAALSELWGDDVRPIQWK